MENYQGTEKLTEISARQWQYVTQENLSAREAVAFLRSGMQVRSFRDVLRQVCGTDQVEQQLTLALCQLSDAQPDSVRRKVWNWMNGRTLPTEREEVLRICFALELPLEQADRMLTLLTDQGIHYRNLWEVVCAYCLRQGLPYGEAKRLMEQLRPSGSRERGYPATQAIRQDFQSVRGEEDLFSFVARHRESLGTHHNTAYRYFCTMLALLTGEALEGEQTYSMEYVADEYLRLNVPKEKKTGRYTDVQKLVKKNWPSPRSIKAMKSRAEDVDRKTLLLLYLVTEGTWGDEYDELDEAYIQPEEILVAHCRRMNKMLMECGMRRIDPRSVFDYLLLYCLLPEDDMAMSQRMSALAAELFAET